MESVLKSAVTLRSTFKLKLKSFSSAYRHTLSHPFRRWGKSHCTFLQLSMSRASQTKALTDQTGDRPTQTQFHNLCRHSLTARAQFDWMLEPTWRTDSEQTIVWGCGKLRDFFRWRLPWRHFIEEKPTTEKNERKQIVLFTMMRVYQPLCTDITFR
jgi:hypothetical protein